MDEEKVQLNRGYFEGRLPMYLTKSLMAAPSLCTLNCSKRKYKCAIESILANYF